MKKLIPLLVFTLFLTTSFITSAQNNALYFDEDAQVVNLSGVSPTQFTVEFNLLFNVTSADWQGVYWSNNSASAGNEEGIYIEDDQTISYWDQNLNGYASDISIELNKWNHVAFTYDGADLKIYINGHLSGVHSIAGLVLPLTDVTMGFGIASAYDYGMGNSGLDDFRIWDVVRSQNEIQSSMNVELSEPYSANLLRYYVFNEGVGGANNTAITTLPEKTGNGTTGTLNFFTLNGSTSNWIAYDSYDTVLRIEENQIKGLNLYPNPTKNLLFINAEEEIKSVKIFNLLGQQLVEKSINAKEVTLDVKTLPTGTYYLLIKTHNTTKSLKILIE